MSAPDLLKLNVELAECRLELARLQKQVGDLAIANTDLGAYCVELIAALRFVRGQVHAARADHHGSFEDCPKSTCQTIREALALKNPAVTA